MVVASGGEGGWIVVDVAVSILVLRECAGEAAGTGCTASAGGPAAPVSATGHLGTYTGDESCTSTSAGEAGWDGRAYIVAV